MKIRVDKDGDGFSESDITVLAYLSALTAELRCGEGARQHCHTWLDYTLQQVPKKSDFSKKDLSAFCKFLRERNWLIHFDDGTTYPIDYELEDTIEAWVNYDESFLRRIFRFLFG